MLTAERAFKWLCDDDGNFSFMEPEETAKLAALVLNECDFNIRASKVFFETLSNDLHAELVGRAANEDDRDE